MILGLRSAGPAHPFGILVSVALTVAGSAQAAVNTGQRSALVIGNSHYVTEPLANPINDARAMAGVLSELGFEVILIEDASIDRLRASLLQVAEQFPAGGVSLFYYAGHAVQQGGTNYLLPVDFTPDGVRELPARSVAAATVLEAMQAAGGGISILILDACRNYPFDKGAEAFGHGLTTMAASGETLVAYATATGEVAEDGQGPNSPYTSALISALEVPGKDVYDVFRTVRGNVREATEGRQVPWISGSLETRLVLRDVAAAVLTTADKEVSAASVHWFTIQNSVDPKDFTDFVKTHAGSPFAARAAERARLLVVEGRPSVADLEVNSGTLRYPGLNLAVTECDIWASGPEDPQRVAPGTRHRLVNTRHAIRACAAAVAADPKNPRLQFNLGRALSIAGRFAEARSFYENAAAADYGAALDALGVMYQRGRGVQRDDVKAMQHLVRAALRGVPAARLNLALMHYDGSGVPQDYAAAVRWLQLAAADGFAPALDMLANMHRDGHGVDADPAEAARLYRAAISLGYSKAMSNLARLYRGGTGVAKNLSEALYWFDRATEAGDAYAPYQLALMLRKGTDLARDPARARDLLELSAERGNEWAFYQIADLYAKGDLGSPDPQKAYYYFLIGRTVGGVRRSRGSEELARAANERLAELQTTLSNETMTRLEGEAARWIEQNSLHLFTFAPGN